ncbi:ABC transporter ATP-binding protein [Clostridiaceae bacterium AF42-6]|jgi:putative ABC transport system ATP-binding protein|nr:ABC transporter ATP-binding protein [Clostridiaceae bacterium AF42-6]
MSVIETNNLQKRYQVGENSVHAVDGVDLNIREGEFVCISGRSGSGKSTLLSLLAGLESPTDGEVILMGEHLEQMNEQERGRFRRDHIGFIFQAYNLLPQFSSWENVAVPLEIRGVPLEQRREKAMEALEMVGLRDHAEHRPTELSGGQQQRISIARAIITRPGIVFADEPTGNLDSRTGTEVMSLLTDLFRRWGTTFLVVSHDEDMNRYTDREIRLKDGKIERIYLREEC